MPRTDREKGQAVQLQTPILSASTRTRINMARVANSRIAFWVFFKTEGVSPFRKLKQFLIYLPPHIDATAGHGARKKNADLLHNI